MPPNTYQAPGEGVRVVDARLAEDGEFEFSDDDLVVTGEGEVGGDRLAKARIGEALAEAVAVRAVGDALDGRGDVVLVMGDLDVGEQSAPLADEAAGA